MKAFVVCVFLLVITDPYRDIDYDKINAYYFFPDTCYENCTSVTEAETNNEFSFDPLPMPKKSAYQDIDLSQNNDFDFDVDLDFSEE